MITRRAQQDTDTDELARLQHENARLRKSLSMRGRLEELVISHGRLRQALHTYGRHTHPNCHDTIVSNDWSDGAKRHPCLCGLDEQLKENPDG